MKSWRPKKAPIRPHEESLVPEDTAEVEDGEDSKDGDKPKTEARVPVVNRPEIYIIVKHIHMTSCLVVWLCEGQWTVSRNKYSLRVHYA